MRCSPVALSQLTGADASVLPIRLFAEEIRRLESKTSNDVTADANEEAAPPVQVETLGATEPDPTPANGDVSSSPEEHKSLPTDLAAVKESPEAAEEVKTFDDELAEVASEQKAAEEEASN